MNMHWLERVEGLRFAGVEEFDPSGVPPVGCVIARIPGEDGATEGVVYLVDPDGENEDGATLYTAWAVYR